MREVRKTIVVATLAAMALKVEAQLPMAHAQAWLACVRAASAGVGGPAGA